ncbi:MAG: multidrug DMT transporter permease [Halothiobacillus sp. 24-54-40]|jgi:drug/metabolite transporter (DMT)-like permease|nr:DMT family transporter [Halothiobacillaceae bacterium]OYV46364.1 MAG: multidrug DMT transporter permease [Halothiobacillus sp. 20-53-49]OYZ85573.1 MAG: multidrug DMT transporter permease [Halothiobacillus sp. 24-54-40]OZA78807.1 MAG: multidrug DMT transporter permease [Halothiobacillus sp. 39-53-45]HUM99719.1 DMT family transporter [Halothiobacillus sp.]
MHNQNNNLWGIYALVMLATLFWGANFVLAGFVLADFSPQWSAAIRFSLAALILWGFAAWQKAPLFTLTKTYGWRYLALGLIGISGLNLLFFFAMQTARADTAALIMATNPLLTTFLAWVLLREHPGWQRLAALPIALLGVAVVISEGNLTQLLKVQIVTGDWLMLAANVCWAFYNVLNRLLLPRNIHSTFNTTLVVTAGALVLLVIALFDPSPLPAHLSLASGLAMLGLVLGGTVFAYLFWNLGIARLGAGRTALFMNLVPVFAMLTAITLGTYPTAMQLLGGAIVFSGLLISMIPNRKPAPPPRRA